MLSKLIDFEMYMRRDIKLSAINIVSADDANIKNNKIIVLLKINTPRQGKIIGGMIRCKL